MLYFQGEPYLHPDFSDIVKYAVNKKIYTATSTNAQLIDDNIARKTVESGLDRLVVSMDGTTQEAYSSYRQGGVLEKTVVAVKNVVKWKKILHSEKPYIIIQFLITRENERQIADIKRLVKSIGADKLQFKTLQVYDFGKNADLIPENQKYSRYYKSKEGSYIIKKNQKNCCWRSWSSVVITWDGWLAPCCFDKNAVYKMGDVNSDSIKNIFDNNLFKDFRKSMLHCRKNIDICNNCTE